MDSGSEGERIAQALSSLEGLASVTRGWPRREAALPCAVVQLAGERCADHRDDGEYLTELEYYVRLFARTAAQLDELGPRVRACMEALGYTRSFAFEGGDESALQRAERYRTIKDIRRMKQ